MRKTGRRARKEEMSAGRIEYIEAARQRLRSRRLRRTILLVVLVAAVVIYLTGVVNTSVMALEDLADTVRIALMPERGFPQQTGTGAVYQVEQLGGSFVVLGEDGCAVYSHSGTKLNNIGTGYARPALAAGKNSFVLYNRSGLSCGWKAAPGSCTAARPTGTCTSAPSAMGASWPWSPTTSASWPW